MRKAYVLSTLLGFALASSAMANTIVAYETPDASYGGGGEFTAFANPAAVLGLPYTGGTTFGTQTGVGYQTFCIESGISFTPGQTYNYSLSQFDHNNVPLTKGTAWLFSQFSSGKLANYDYVFGAGRVATAGQLQAAIWYFQGQPTPGGFGYSGGPGNIFTDEANAALTALGQHAFDASGGEFGVSILSLFDGAGNPAQDMLSAPDGGVTLLLLGGVLSGLALIRRKLV